MGDINNKIISLPIAKINFSDEIDGLRKVKLKICKEGFVPSHGLFIDKSAIIDAQESLKNKPILCAYEIDENGEKTDFKGHEMEYKIYKEGSVYVLKINYIEQPVGHFNETSNIQIEEIDGETWLTAEGYLYSQYCEDAIRILEENSNEKSVSMEIKVTSNTYSEDEALTHITGFMFQGVTLLGESHQPAIKDANVQLFSQNDTFALEFTKLLEQVDKFNLDKGGNKVIDEIREGIISKYSHLKANTKFEVITSNEELSNDDLEKELFSLSLSDLKDKVRESLGKITYTNKDSWGDEYEYRKYWLEDILYTENIAIVEDNENYGVFVGVPFTQEGDSVELQIDKVERYIRGDWRKYDSGKDVIEINPIFEDLIKYNKEKIENKQSEFENTKTELDEVKVKFTDLQTEKTVLDCEVNDLRTFKFDYEEQLRKEEEQKKIDEFNNLFSRYSELSKLEGFEEIKKLEDISLEQLEVQLKVLAFDNGVIIGKKSKKNEPTINIIKTGLSFEKPSNEDLSEAEKRYGSDIKKYLD